MESKENIAKEMPLRRTAGKQKEYRTLRMYTWVFTLLASLAVVAAFFTLWLFGVQVRDVGMAPSVMPGDVILFDRLAKHVKAPDRGDVVAYSGMTGAGTYIGRIVALPGEKVDVYEGRVYIGGLLLDERGYASGALSGEITAHTVPEGHYFILPDDRTHALVDADKLTVEASRIRGRAFLRVSPLDRLGIF
ncbi:MAG: signal peptidase I [Clostridiales bacterium]|nr:signal peptidase I [Clostridiales bacterium]